MEVVMAAATWVAAKLGMTGGMVYGAMLVIQLLSKAELKALIAAGRGFVDLVTNVPRRWKSETARIREIVAKLREDGQMDEAAAKEAKMALQVAVRVLVGIVEDVLNSLIDLLFVLVPFINAIYAAFKGTKKPKVA